MAEDYREEEFQYTGDPSQEDEGGSFEWHSGDRFVVCVEESTIKRGAKGPYAAMVYRVVAGPMGDLQRDAGPGRKNDGGVFSLRIWDNLSFSEAAGFRMRAFLRGIGRHEPLELRGLKAQEQLQEQVVDRELAVSVILEEYQGKPSPKVAEYHQLSAVEQKRLHAAYAEFGMARGYGWTDEQMEPFVPYEPPQEPEDVAL